MSDGLYAPRPMRSEDPLGAALARLEAPDCRCPRRPNRCGHAGPCDCPDQNVFDLGAPCRHVLGADHGLSPDRWLLMLLHFDPEGFGGPPPPGAPAQALTRTSRLELYAARAEAGVGMHFPVPPGRKWRSDGKRMRYTGDAVEDEDLDGTDFALAPASKRPSDLKAAGVVRSWRPSRAELEESAAELGWEPWQVEEIEDAYDASDENDDVLSRCAKAARLRTAPPEHPGAPPRAEPAPGRCPWCGRKAHRPGGRGDDGPAVLPLARPAAGETPIRRAA